MIKLNLCLRFLFLSFFILTEANSATDNIFTKKIICIGDSITQGGTVGRQEFTYRLPLQKLIFEKGLKVDFVGVKKEGLHKNFIWPKNFDPDHEGFYGKNSSFIRDALKTDLKKIEPPAIAIIHIGTNDNDSIMWSPIVEPSVDIIRQLRAKNPNVKILYIQIPGKVKYIYTHIWMWFISITMSTKSSPILTIDSYSDWNNKYHTFDGVHPNPEGQVFLAKLIFSKLENILK